MEIVTGFIVLLVPLGVAGDVLGLLLLLLVLLLAALVEHLLEEMELCISPPDQRAE